MKQANAIRDSKRLTKKSFLVLDVATCNDARRDAGWIVSG